MQQSTRFVIKRVRLNRFKRFDDELFDLTGDSVILAGPNNSGKTTLLHAISAWALALKSWLLETGDKPRTKRITLLIDELTALPLREMNLLWLDRHTARKVPGSKTPKAAPIYVEVFFSTPSGEEESITIEFLYANQKSIYIRPVVSIDNTAPLGAVPAFAKDIHIVHVPPFSGIGAQEPRHGLGMQSKLVGEGKPGEIVRNLLLEIWEASGHKASVSPWKDLANQIVRLFGYDLLPPVFTPQQPYIVSEYRPGTDKASGRGPALDIANAGSGFHQVLLLLSFIYARRASVLLIDEPDAHLHFILQREIFDLLRIVAEQRGCKLIVATHAEVLLEEAEPDQVLSFLGHKTQRLVDPKEKRTLTAALRNLTSLDLLQANQVGAVLYVEDISDQKILREWAIVLEHPAKDFLLFPFVVPLKGKGNLDKARRHFECLRMAQPSIKGICILDQDNQHGGDPSGPFGLTIVRWNRYEIENYLINPNVLKRFLEGRPIDLFNAAQIAEARKTLEEEFAETFPASMDYLSDVRPLREIKGGDFIVETLALTSVALEKKDLYMLAQRYHSDEIHKDVVAMLDKIAAMLPIVVPAIVSNLSPLDENGVMVDGEPSGDQPT